MSRLAGSLLTGFNLAVVTIVVAMWVAFWGLVTRIHLIVGDWLSAGVVMVVFVFPAVVGLAYYFRAVRPVAA